MANSRSFRDRIRRQQDARRREPMRAESVQIGVWLVAALVAGVALGL